MIGAFDSCLLRPFLFGVRCPIASRPVSSAAQILGEPIWKRTHASHPKPTACVPCTLGNVLFTVLVQIRRQFAKNIKVCEQSQKEVAASFNDVLDKRGLKPRTL